VGRRAIGRVVSRVNINPTAEETAPNREYKTKRYNRVSPTESRKGRSILVSLR